MYRILNARVVMAGVCALAIAGGMASGDVIVYQDGATNAFVAAPYEGAQDNLLAGSNKRHDDNLGAYASAGVGNIGWGTYDPPIREIIRFDLTSFAGRYASINSVKLTLTLSKAAKSETVTVHQILAANSDWVEGAGTGSTSAAGESCWWYKAWPDVEWAGGVDSGCGVAGVDYDSTAVASHTWVAAEVDGTALELTLAGDVNAMVDQWSGAQADNAGLILRTTTEDDQTLHLTWKASEFTTDPAMRPMLTIDYEPIPEPASAMLMLLGGLALARRRRK